MYSNQTDLELEHIAKLIRTYCAKDDELNIFIETVLQSPLTKFRWLALDQPANKLISQITFRSRFNPDSKVRLVGIEVFLKYLIQVNYGLISEFSFQLQTAYIMGVMQQDRSAVAVFCVAPKL